MTIISPLLISISIPFNAQKSPKFTFTPLVEMIVSLTYSVAGFSSVSYSLMLILLLLL